MLGIAFQRAGDIWSMWNVTCFTWVCVCLCGCTCVCIGYPLSCTITGKGNSCPWSFKRIFAMCVYVLWQHTYKWKLYNRFNYPAATMKTFMAICCNSIPAKSRRASNNNKTVRKYNFQTKMTMTMTMKKEEKHQKKMKADIRVFE